MKARLHREVAWPLTLRIYENADEAGNRRYHVDAGEAHFNQHTWGATPEEALYAFFNNNSHNYPSGGLYFSGDAGYGGLTKAKLVAQLLSQPGDDDVIVTAVDRNLPTLE